MTIFLFVLCSAVAGIIAVTVTLTLVVVMTSSIIEDTDNSLLDVSADMISETLVFQTSTASL